MEINKRQIIIYSIIALAILSTLIGAATYAYFASSVSVTNTLNISAVTANGSFSFISYSEGAINMNLTATNMLSNVANNTTPKTTDSANLIVKLSSPGGSSTNCTFNISWTWEDGSDYYESKASMPTLELEKSAFPANYHYQFSVTVLKNGTPINFANSQPESDLQEFTWTSHGTNMLSGMTISAGSGIETVDKYLVTAKMYNIATEQPDIKGKHFNAQISTNHAECLLT